MVRADLSLDIIMSAVQRRRYLRSIIIVTLESIPTPNLTCGHDAKEPRERHNSIPKRKIDGFKTKNVACR